MGKQSTCQTEALIPASPRAVTRAFFHCTLSSSAVLTSLLELPQKKSRLRILWPIHLFPLTACAFFFLAGLAFIPRLGIENDEALFASPWYQPKWEEYALHVGRTRLPLMLMNYLGTLKSWIYRPIFLWFGAGVRVTRIPMLLAGVASLWLFYLLLRRVAGEQAAIIGCCLLAADASSSWPAAKCAFRKPTKRIPAKVPGTLPAMRSPASRQCTCPNRRCSMTPSNLVNAPLTRSVPITTTAG